MTASWQSIELPDCPAYWIPAGCFLLSEFFFLPIPMPEERGELSRGCPRGILSPLRLPFRHSGECLGLRWDDPLGVPLLGEHAFREVQPLLDIGEPSLHVFEPIEPRLNVVTPAHPLL